MILSGWRGALLAPFVAGVSRLTVAADPDRLLDDQQVIRELTTRGFSIATYDDPIAFRLEYETGWRDGWEGGSRAELIVRCVCDADQLVALPFDVLSGARVVSVSRAALFPGAPARALAWMSDGDLDWLWSKPSHVDLDRIDLRARSLEAQLDVLERGVPAEGSGHGEWTEYAMRWAQAQATRMEDAGTPRAWENRVEALHDRIEAAFARWMEGRFASLSQLPPDPPVMVHRVARAMARSLEEGSVRRVALLVLDGMSFEQWITLRSTLDLAALRVTERASAVFAWVPTITSVSRQAIFAGLPPRGFGDRLESTSGEEQLWKSFWAGAKLAPEAIGYVRGLGEDPCDKLDEQLHDPRVRALGLVVDKVDRIMHGMEGGALGMHNQVRQWGATRWLQRMLQRLLDEGFEIYLTSDHGNIEAVGVGVVADRDRADLRGERARVYPNEALRQKIALEVPAARCWDDRGLPQGFLPLLAAGRAAFVSVKERVVGHGGIAMEEVIVPLVILSRRG